MGIQDFPDERGQQKCIIWQDFTINCIKMKEIGPKQGKEGSLAISTLWIRHCEVIRVHHYNVLGPGEQFADSVVFNAFVYEKLMRQFF